MIQSLLELTNTLKSIALKDCPIAELSIPESQDKAFAIKVPYQDRLNCWQIARSLLAETSMYPVLTDCCFSKKGNWQSDVIEENFFNRFPYSSPYPNRKKENVAPDRIIEVANATNRREILNEMRQDLPTIESEMEFDSDWYAYDLKNIQREFDLAPELQDVKRILESEKIVTLLDFEQWLFNWELENIPLDKLLLPPDLRYLEWYEPLCEENISEDEDRTTILLLPAVNSWDILAYLHFFGAGNSSTEIAILKYWHDKYGAELVAHYGTMLHLYVQQKPKTLEEAFELAWQQYIFAPCTLALPGVSLREHARALLHTDRWFLHERP